MGSHESIQELLPLYALGALTPAESALVRNHLAQCAECSALYRAQSAVVEMMPRTVEPVAPSPGTKAKLLARIDADLAGAPAARPAAALPRRAPVAAPPRRVGFARPVFAFAVIAILALLVLAGGIYYFNRPTAQEQTIAAIRSDPQVQKVALAGTPDAPNASAEMYMVPGHTQAVLVVNGLPPLPQDKGYEFWFFKGGEPQPSNVFTVNPDGTTNVLVQANDRVENFKGWGVTIEPRAGVPKPTGTLVIAGGF